MSLRDYVYCTNVFDASAFSEIQQLCSELDRQIVIQPPVTIQTFGNRSRSVGNNNSYSVVPRRSVYLDKERNSQAFEKLCRFFSGAPVLTIVQEEMRKRGDSSADDWLLADDFEIRYTRYDPGAAMHWHSDALVYNVPQIECVFTVHNTSDAVTEFAAPKPANLVSEPNSIVLLQAQQISHRVRASTHGTRGILKVVYKRRGSHLPPKTVPFGSTRQLPPQIPTNISQPVVQQPTLTTKPSSDDKPAALPFNHSISSVSTFKLLHAKVEANGGTSANGTKAT